jgi:hypothetical protein
VNRSRLALARAQLVTDAGPPTCRQCAERLQFSSDRDGRLLESCGCGYRAFVPVRGGRADPPGERALHAAPAR